MASLVDMSLLPVMLASKRVTADKVSLNRIDAIFYLDVSNTIRLESIFDHF